jgi:fimbrial chaperone protein
VRGFVTLLFIVAAHAASGASVSINPVRLNLGAQQPVGSLSLTNQGTEPVVLQLDVAAWTQSDGQDVDTPTDDLLATPPMVSIAPGATQLVRVGLRHPAPSAQERSYRLFLQEIPNETVANTSALQFRLRFAVPVFVPTADTSDPSLIWDASESNGTLTVRAHNASSRHVQVISMSTHAGDANVLTSAAPSYVLPGQTRAWTSSWSATPADALRVEASTDAGPMHADLRAPSR